jgi:PIN domain nuclease of toxin-antitoxin system
VSKYILDASAILALLQREVGSDQVSTAIAAGAAIGTVNLSEVVAKLAEAGMPQPVIHQAVDPLGLDVHAFDESLAYGAGSLRVATKQLGLSLGDRCCVALARALNLPLLTSDRAWGNLDIGIEVRVIR